MIGYVKYFDSSETMSLKANDNTLGIWYHTLDHMRKTQQFNEYRI